MKVNQRAKARQQSLRQSKLKSFFTVFKRSKLTKLSSRGIATLGKDRKASSSHRGPADKTILFTTMALVFFGWVMVYSASFYVASQTKDTLFTDYNSYHFFILQGLWIIAGSIAAYFAYTIPTKWYRLLIIPGLLIIFSLLVVVLFLPATINGAKLWIKIGPITMQPSEFAKPALIIYLAAIFAKQANKSYQDFATYFRHKILPFLLVVVPLVSLVLMGRDLAAAGLIIMIAGGMFFMVDNHFYTNLTVLAGVLIAVIFASYFTVSEPYRLERVETFIDAVKTGAPKNPLSSGYQLTQILTAVGSGGVSGYGFGQSKQKYYYLQETAFNDTIFAVVAEEFGFLGSVALIVLFFILISKALKVAQLSASRFNSLMALGIALWLFLQSIIHLGVNVGMIPLTGITLPFMSYGGSSLISCLIGIGILLNISREVKLE